MRPGDEQYNVGLPQGPGTPDFPFPVRIPSFLLPEHLHLRGKEFINGIATSSHVDLIQQLLLYRVHMEHGFSMDINVGFVEIILPPGEDNETQQHIHCNDTADTEDFEEGGRPSSCDELDDEENNLWAPELLHSQFQNLSFPVHEDDLQYNVDESDLDVQEAARLLMDDNEVRGEIPRGESRSNVQEQRSMGDKGGRQGRASGRGKRPVKDLGDRGLQEGAGRVAREARAAARASTVATSSTAAAATAASSGRPAATSSSWSNPGVTESAPSSFQGGFHFTERTDFLPNDSSDSDVDGLEEGMMVMGTLKMLDLLTVRVLGPKSMKLIIQNQCYLRKRALD
jgi:hypothetical protein